MSIEKVKRYDMRVDNPSIESDTGRYIEYADVAGLVEALKEYVRVHSVGFNGKGREIVEAFKNARNELARWTL